MKYKEGYVAFVDILGFSCFVLDEGHFEKTKRLFSFIEKLCHLFNTSNLDVKIAFFSDSIIFTSEKCNLSKMAFVIRIAESYLWDELRLVFRGGITKGKYYNEKGIAFGPAIVSAYRLEQKADTARILLDDTIEEKNDLIIMDDDKFQALNLEYLTIFDNFAIGANGVSYKQEDFILAFENRRKKILEMINEYQEIQLKRKYEFKKKCFNNILRLIIDNPFLYKEEGIELPFDDISRLNELFL